VIGASLVLYAVICAFCLLVSDSTASILIKENVLWMFGPPANLIYGWRYLLPFAIGTPSVALVFFSMVRAATTGRRLMLLLGFLLSWCLFGFIAYFPGV